MSRGTIVKARAQHIIPLAQNLREADRREVEASTRESPMRGIYHSYKVSSHCWTGLVDDRPVMMFGVAPLSVLSGLGAPWMLATPELLSHRRQFIRECREYVDIMQTVFPELMNYVDVRNTESIKWLRWLGFEVDDPVQFGVNGEMFHPFRRAA